eukprot:s4226_g2.t2
MFPSQKFWLLLLAAPTMASNDTTNATVNVSTSLQMTTACHAVCDGLSDLQLDLHELRQRHVSGEDVTLLEQCMAARCPSSRSFRKLSARSFPQRHAAVVKCIFQARVACPSLQSLKDGRAEELPKAEEPQQAQSQPAEEPKKAEAKKPEDAKAEEEHDTWSEEKREDYCCCTTLSPLARACSTATSAASQRHQHLQETLRPGERDGASEASLRFPDDGEVLQDWFIQLGGNLGEDIRSTIEDPPFAAKLAAVDVESFPRDCIRESASVLLDSEEGASSSKQDLLPVLAEAAAVAWNRDEDANQCEVDFRTSVFKTVRVFALSDSKFLELEPMSTAQRLEVRNMVKQYAGAGIKYKAYGFGEGRTLAASVVQEGIHAAVFPEELQGHKEALVDIADLCRCHSFCARLGEFPDVRRTGR